MPAKIDPDVYAQVSHFADAGDKRSVVIKAIIDGTYTPVVTQGAGKAGSISTSGNGDFDNLPTTTLVLKLSADGGSTFPTTRTHTFGAGPFADIDAVIADIEGDAAFLGGGTPDLVVSSDDTELIISFVPTLAGLTGRIIKVDATSTGIDGDGLLAFTDNQLSLGAGLRYSVQICDQSLHKLAGVKDLVARAIGATGSPTLTVGTKGTAKAGDGSAEVWLVTDSTGAAELILAASDSGDLLLKFITDNGETELQKITLPLP